MVLLKNSGQPEGIILPLILVEWNDHASRSDKEFRYSIAELKPPLYAAFSQLYSKLSIFCYACNPNQVYKEMPEMKSSRIERIE